MLLVIDPGHGGSDPGAVSTNNLYKEKDNVLAICRGIHGKEINMPPDVRFAYTRLKDEFVELERRIYFANSINANLFISVHQNADTQRSGHGVETYYYPGSVEGERLARAVHEALIRNTGLYDRGIKQNGEFYILRHTKMPAILIEAGFVGGDPEEAELVSRKDMLNKMAEGILMGVADYLGVKYGPQTPAWDPQEEIDQLLDDGIINTPHTPEQPVTWGELATVLNRIRNK